MDPRVPQVRTSISFTSESKPQSSLFRREARRDSSFSHRASEAVSGEGIAVISKVQNDLNLLWVRDHLRPTQL